MVRAQLEALLRYAHERLAAALLHARQRGGRALGWRAPAAGRAAAKRRNPTRRGKAQSRTARANDSDESDVSLPPELREKRGPRKTLVLDLDETLVHSTSQGSRTHDHVVEVVLDGHLCIYFVHKRPYVDYFLEKVTQWFDVYIYTASLPEYADPVIDFLESHPARVLPRRLFRQHCSARDGGHYVKDLAIAQPDLARVAIIDNCPTSYLDHAGILASFFGDRSIDYQTLQTENAIPIATWVRNPDDCELLNMLPFLEALQYVGDVRSVLGLRTK